MNKDRMKKIGEYLRDTWEWIANKDLESLYETKQDALKLAETVFKNDSDEREKAMNPLWKELRALEAKIEKADKPYKAKVDRAERTVDSLKTTLTVMKRAVDTCKAQAMAVKTKEDASAYIDLLPISRHNVGENVRQISHARGKDIVVFGWSGEYCKGIYLAFKDGKIFSALIAEKAEHIGDWTSTFDFGCKYDQEVMKEKSKFHSSSRSGICMKEWLDPELVCWVGMPSEELLNFCNMI